MSSILCRLCARTDESGSVVVGEEKLRKRIPLRVQEFLTLDFQNDTNKCVTICRNCQNMVETIDGFFYKVQAAQKIWAAINIEIQDNETSKFVITQKPKKREAKLVPFLVRSLDSGCFRGLVWEDRNLGLFRLPWPRQGTNKWRPEDSQLFKEWAILKGRYSEKEDFVLWKTCIRTSLHKLPNVKEVRELHNFSANPPYKVYRITDFPDGFLAMSKSVHMDHNYIRSEENIKTEQVVELNEEHAEELILPDNGQSHTSPIQYAFIEKADEGVIHAEETPVVEIKLIEDQGNTTNDSIWIIAQEETIGNEDESKFTSTLSEMPSQETVARWIQGLKRSAPARFSIESSNNHYVCVSPIEEKHLGKDESQNSSDVQEHFSSRVSQASSKSNISHSDSEMSLHMSTSDEEEVIYITSESLEKKTSRPFDPQTSSNETFQSIHDSSFKGYFHSNNDGNKSKNSNSEKADRNSEDEYSLSSSIKKSPKKRTRMSNLENKTTVRVTRMKTAPSTMHLRKREPSIEKNSFSSPHRSRSKKNDGYRMRGRKRQWSPSNSSRKRECSECGKQFHNVCELVKHRQKCRQNSQHNLPGSKTLTTIKSLQAAKPNVKNYSRNNKCNICDKAFIDPKSLDDHINTHLNLKYECKRCEECFFSSQDLQVHLKTHSKS